MTTVTDICNRALQGIGTRTTVTDAELANNDTNEAIQFNLVFENLRDDLSRMAPWNCVMRTANLTYISSVPGTPENSSPATNLWQPGQPAPPFAYEYQYPVDCLRALYIIPSTQTGFSSGVPLTPAVTGGGSSFWWGSPIKFQVQTDLFYPVTAVAIVNGGINFAVGDIITLPLGPTSSPPIGAPLQLRVESLGAFNAAASVSIVNSIMDSETPMGGSYFAPQLGPISQGSTTGAGTFFVCSLTFGAQTDQRVLLTNQEFATLNYCRRITNPNVWDTLFQSALIDLLSAAMWVSLRGNINEANKKIEEANRSIEAARSIDGNEGLTTNDVTPDWIRVRGVSYTEGYASGPYSSYDWGGLWPSFI